MLLWLKFGAIAAVLAGAAYGGWQVRDWQAAEDDLKRERAAAEQLAAIQKGMDLAARETERRLAEAARNAAGARADSDRVRELASRVRASEQASERDRRRVEELGRLAAESAELLREGEEHAGRAGARLAGCQAAP